MNASLEKTEMILGRTATFFATIGGFFIFLMMMHICADVLLKYVFNSPIPGTLEIVSAIYMTIVVFFPLMAVTLFDGHISVTLFSELLNLRARKIMIFLVSLFCFLVTAYVFYAGFDQALRKMAAGESWETASGYISIWYARWSFPIGMGLTAVAFGWVTLQSYLALTDGRGNSDNNMGPQ